MEMCKTDINQLIRDIVEKFNPIVKEKKLTIEFSNNKEFNNVKTDILVSKVLENIMSNAIKYSKNNKRIFIIFKKISHRMQIEIRDEGQGLSRDAIEELFTPYSQLRSIPGGNEQSSDIGLSIAKKIVTGLDGKLWAKSDGKGKGSVFFVNLPIIYSKQLD